MRIARLSPTYIFNIVRLYVLLRVRVCCFRICVCFSNLLCILRKTVWLLLDSIVLFWLRLMCEPRSLRVPQAPPRPPPTHSRRRPPYPRRMPHPPSCLRCPLDTLAPLPGHQPQLLLLATPHHCRSHHYRSRRCRRSRCGRCCCYCPRRFFFARGCRWSPTWARRRGQIRKLYELFWRREGSLPRRSSARTAA